MRFLKFLILSVCPVLAIAQTADQDWRFAHPGATLVGGIRVEALLQSPILNTVIEQATAKDPATSAMVGMMRGVLGGISEIRISLLDVGPGKDPDVLALVTGRMDEAAATALAQGKTKVHRVDANTLLLGEGKSLAEAIVRLSQPAPAQSNRAVQRGKTVTAYDLWIAGTLPAVPMTAMLGDLLQGLSLGFSLQDDLRAELALETASPQMAEELIRKAREAQRGQPAAKDVALLADVDGTTARFRVSVEKSVVMQAIEEAVGNAAPMFQPLAPKFKEKEPEKETITIYGLDDGPREIDPTRGR